MYRGFSVAMFDYQRVPQRTSMFLLGGDPMVSDQPVRTAANPARFWWMASARAGTMAC